MGFIIPDHKAGYFLGVLRGIGGVGPLDSHDQSRDFLTGFFGPKKLPETNGV